MNKLCRQKNADDGLGGVAIMGGKTGLLVIGTKKNKLRLCLAHALHYLCV